MLEHDLPLLFLLVPVGLFLFLVVVALLTFRALLLLVLLLLLSFDAQEVIRHVFQCLVAQAGVCALHDRGQDLAIARFDLHNAVAVSEARLLRG